VVMRDRGFDLSPAQIKQLLRAPTEKLNNDDRLIIERGRAALAQLHRHPSGRVKRRPAGNWNLWIIVGHALLVCRAAAMAEAGDHRSPRYAAAVGYWLREEGFGALDRLTRTHLLNCMLHLAAIDQWRLSLPATSRNLLNHPTRTWRAWLRAGRRLFIAAERPAVVLQTPLFGETIPLPVCLITSVASAAPLLRVALPAGPASGLEMPSWAAIDMVTTVRQRWIGRRIGHLDDTTMLAVGRALLVFLGLA
jgi:mRNA interferase MazF